MRIVLGIVAACVLAAGAYFGAVLLGLIGIAPWAAPITLILGLALLVVSQMTTIREILKQIAIWLAIVTLLPLCAWYAASATSGMPDPREGSKARDRINAQLAENEKTDKATYDKAQKETLRQERDQLRQQMEQLG